MFYTVQPVIWQLTIQEFWPRFRAPNWLGTLLLAAECAAGHCWLLNFDQFHFENERLKWWNSTARPALAVAQFLRDDQLNLLTFLHKLQTFGPAGNYSVERE